MIAPGPRHQCIIYSGAPSKKLPVLVSVMHQMMLSGYRCLYLNSPAMVAGVRSALAACGVEVEKEVEAGRIILSSEPVSVDGNFNCEMMIEQLENTLDAALKDGYTGLWASGDITWEFAGEKNFEKLLEYETRLEAFFQRRKEFYGICQYHRDTLPLEAVRDGLLTHRHLFISDTLCRLNPHFKNPGTEERAAGSRLDTTIEELCRLHAAPQLCRHPA